MTIDAQSPSGCSQTVCVTGAGGYIASQLLKLLLQRGYTIKGTIRSPVDPKNEHLRAVEGAAERPVLRKADLLDYDALRAAIDGCHGIFHTASPVAYNPESMVEPAVRRTESGGWSSCRPSGLSPWIPIAGRMWLGTSPAGVIWSLSVY